MKFPTGLPLFSPPILENMYVSQSLEQTAANLAADILHCTKETIKKKGRCVWALSGGSSILKFYDALTGQPGPGPDVWSRLVVCWVDERHVPHEHEESNYGNANRYFWKHTEGPVLIPVPWHASLELSAKEYQNKLSDHGIEQGGDIDILLLGMGTDGHIASLFPYSDSLQVQSSNVTAGILQKEGINRITMTYPMINHSQKIKLFAYGAEKGATFRKAFKQMNKQKYPVLGINFNNCMFYVDELFHRAARNGGT